MNDMDPNATWATVTSSESLHDRAAAALHLLHWLANGGFPPDVATEQGPNGRNVITQTCHLVIGNALDRLDELTPED